MGLGVVPGGGRSDQLATGAHVLDEGTQSARIGKAVGEIVGGLAITGVGTSASTAGSADAVAATPT